MFLVCQKDYQNVTISKEKYLSGCKLGCNLGTRHQQDLLKTVPVDTIDSIKIPENTPLLVNDNQKLAKNNKLFSIFLPIPIRSSNNLLEQTTSQVEDFVPHMMMSMIKNIADRARRIMEFSQKSNENDLIFGKTNIKDDSLSTNVQGQISFDPKTGESVSVQRSMSVMMAKDKDGHNKMIVMRNPPKITINRDLFRK